jgi:hypothetical protein
MKQPFNDHRLYTMAVPTAKPSQHQAQLRRVLVSRAAQRADDKVTFLQGVLHFMSKRTIFASVGVAGMLALAVVAFSGLNTSPVNAMQLAKDSSKALQTIEISNKDSVEITKTYKQYSPQFESWLEAAQHASDLRVLSYDEVVAAYPLVTQADSSEKTVRIISSPYDGQTPDLHHLRYLEFTSTQDGAASKIVIGVNDDNVPVAAIMHFVTAQPVRN